LTTHIGDLDHDFTTALIVEMSRKSPNRGWASISWPPTLRLATLWGRLVGPRWWSSDFCQEALTSTMTLPEISAFAAIANASLTFSSGSR
jgi:hypothetical protein